MINGNRIRWLLKIASISLNYFVSFINFLKKDGKGFTILNYHNISNNSVGQLNISPQIFEKQVKYLKNNYLITSLDEIINWIEKNNLEKISKSIVITFDDGYEDIYKYAFPILYKYKAPAIIYLATKFIQEGRAFKWPKIFFTEETIARPLNYSQITKMLKSGIITFGSHTHSHLPASIIPIEVFQKDVQKSCEWILKNLGFSPKHFSYPYDDYTKEIDKVIRNYFETATYSTYERNVLPCDLLKLKKVPVQKIDNNFIFQNSIAGRCSFYGKIIYYYNRWKIKKLKTI